MWTMRRLWASDWLVLHTHLDLHLSHNLNSFKGGLYRGLYRGTTIGVIKGDTRSLDSGSFRVSGFRVSIW